MALKEKILDRAQKFIQKGSIDKAIVEYKAALDVDPKDIAIRLRIGELYVKINRNAEAIKEYTEAAKANAQRGFYLKAIAVYKQVLKLDDNLELHYKLADLYTRQRLIADAISEYSYIVATFEKKGKTNDVLELLKKMIGIDPENIGVRIKLAELYHKLSFGKDALAEYSSIFAKLLEQGKLDKAEKIYLGLVHSNPKEPVILKGLADLYRQKDDTVQFLKFALPLFHVYRETDDTDAAKEVSAEILRHRPNDPDCFGFMERFKPKDEATGAAPESWTEESGAEKKQVQEEKRVEPLVSSPEEEIEITLEGFEDVEPKAAEGAVSEVSAAVESGEATGERAEVKEEKTEQTAASEEAEVEIEVGGVEDVIAQEAGEPVKDQTPALQALAVPEAEVSVPSEDMLVEAEAKEEPAVTEEPEVEVSAPSEDILVEAEAREEPMVTEVPEAVEEEPVEDAASAEESLEDVLEEAIEEVNLKISEAEARQAEVEFPEERKFEVSGSETGNIEQQLEAPLEDKPSVEQEPELPADIEEPVVEAPAEPSEVIALPRESGAEDAQEELSGAITELIEKTEAELDRPGLIEKISPEEMLLEPERLKMEETPESGKGEDYVDLSAELGMEETIQDMAGSWGGSDSKEAYDEFKSGIGQQLSREDTETHYNLGIAYMEMELYGEASKEFKIALKDPHLEFDCLTRLGLCAVSEGNAHEAIGFYLKGLKVEGRSDSERMGMMYELALAYEAAGDGNEADKLFNAIYDIDPGYREVSGKVTLSLPRVDIPRIPLDDGLIEVELL
ncbi:MAG: tetratricopeptide repeat protein [Deltaproteobacteria bacterium]|nr:tetratricopeptide repeat protein [Deltaproteobacteria bacterium]